jgi:hypothetical protein
MALSAHAQRVNNAVRPDFKLTLPKGFGKVSTIAAKAPIFFV